MSNTGNGRLKMRNSFDFKALGTLAAQGAIGGGAGCFLLTVFRIFYLPSAYNFLLVYLFLFYLLPSLVVGATAAGLIWFAGKILNRKPGFLASCGIGIVATTVIAIPYSLESEFIINWRLFLLSSLIVGGCA